MYDFYWDVVFARRDEFVQGLWLALQLAFFGLAIGSAIGLLAAFARTSGRRILRVPATIYVEFIRGVPLLLLIFIFYFGLPIFAYQTFRPAIADRLVLDGETSAVVALAIYAGSYLAEVFRAGILAVSGRYLDAGRSIGLTGWGVARYITLPIMFRSVLPSLSNTFISLFKDTSLAFAISVHELTFVARKLNTDTFRTLEAWTAAGALYLITSYLLALVMRLAERRIRWST